MLVYDYTRVPLTFYPSQPRLVHTRTPTPYERYSRAVAELQSARNNYLDELEGQWYLEALRRREVLRQVKLRRRQAQTFFDRRPASYPYIGHSQSFIFDTSVRHQPFQKEEKVPSSQHQEQLLAVNELLEALIGVSTECDIKDKLCKEQPREEAPAKHGETEVHKNADAVRQEVQSVPQKTEPPSEGSSHLLGKFNKTPTQPFSRGFSAPELSVIHQSLERAARTIQRQWRSHSSDAAAREDALTTIETLRTRFRFLRDTFHFPEHLEFRPQESSSLLYSPANAGVHAYTNELTKLLMNADAVPARGSDRVRNARRSFVRDVEEQLEVVEAKVKTVWNKQVEGTATNSHEAPSTTPADAGVSAGTVDPPHEPELTSISTARFEASNFSPTSPQVSPVVVRTSSEEHPQPQNGSHPEHSSEHDSSNRDEGVSDAEGNTDLAVTSTTTERTPAVEFVEIQHSDLNDPVENTPDEVLQHEAEDLENDNAPFLSSEAVPSLSSKDQDGTELEISQAHTSSDSAQDSPTVQEPFDIVYPDSRSASPAVSDVDPSGVQSDPEIWARKTELIAHEEGFELL